MWINFIFILFFLFLFFNDSNSYYKSFFFAVLAGIFLDIYSYSYFGISIALLLMMVFLFKKLMQSLNKREDRYPAAYFFPLFIIFYSVYEILFRILIFILGPQHIGFFLTWNFALQLSYNLFFACLGFYAAKFLKRNGLFF